LFEEIQARQAVERLNISGEVIKWVLIRLWGYSRIRVMQVES
jgi:hypothetical protein